MSEFGAYLRGGIRSFLLVATLLILLAGSFVSGESAAYHSLIKEPNTKVSSPPVELQAGTAQNCTSTIYANSTSAKVSLGTDVIDYVDNNSSNVDNSTNKGIHSDFAAQQHGPDLINDTLTEQNTGKTLIIRPNAAGKRSDWNPVGSTNNWECVDEAMSDEDTTFVNTTLKNKKDFYNLQNHTTETGSISNVRLYVRAKGNTGAEIISALAIGEDEYLGQTRTLTTSYANYYDDWAENPATLANWTWSDIDVLEAGFRSSGTVEHRVTQLYIDVTYGHNYELDLEVQWTDVDYNETNEYLCIYGGTIGSENITLAVWNGTGWEKLFDDLSSGWNNVSVSSHLDSSTFTIRFKGSIETNDTTQDSLDTDVTLLHVWTEAGSGDFNYVLKMVEKYGSNWKVRLRAYDQSNIGRLDNLTIYVYDGANSTQIVISNGAYSQQTGSWYDLNASDTEYIWIHFETSTAGTSYIYTFLEILVPNKTTYAQYVITFKIT